MTKWEYTVFEGWTYSYDLQDILNNLGRDGWEVISVVAFPDFKREVWAKRPLPSINDLLLENTWQRADQNRTHTAVEIPAVFSPCRERSRASAQTEGASACTACLQTCVCESARVSCG